MTAAPDVIGPPRPIRYLASYHGVRAMQFDGSRESAAAIAAKFPGRVAWSVEREGTLLALASKPFSSEPLTELAPGSWLVETERWHAEFFIVLRDEHFRAGYTACRYQDEA